MFRKIVAKPTNIAKWSMNDEAVFLSEKGVLEAINDVKDGDGKTPISRKVEGETESNGADGWGPRVFEVDTLFLVGSVGAHASDELVEIFAATFDFWSEDDWKDLATGRHILNWLRSGAKVDELIFVILGAGGLYPEISVLSIKAFPKRTRRERRLGKVSNVSKAKTNHRIKDRAKALIISEALGMNDPAKLDRDLAMIVGELEALQVFNRASGGQGLVIIDRNNPALPKVVTPWDLVKDVVVGMDSMKDGQHVVLVGGEGETNRLPLRGERHCESFTMLRIKR